MEEPGDGGCRDERRRSGGIMAIAPGIASIAMWSPNLDQHGNSMLNARTAGPSSVPGSSEWSVSTHACRRSQART
ncbi:glutaminase [Sphingomonas faeni]|uniref:glutaminase n=1 Tax=Sphingomonas faeni TaxID=185950 RepID=UPI003364FC1B